MRRLELDGCVLGSLASPNFMLGIGFPSRLQMRIYDCCVPAATIIRSPEKSRQLMLEIVSDSVIRTWRMLAYLSCVLWKVYMQTLTPGPTPLVLGSILKRSRYS
jgi:hypothetical protein